MRTALKVTGFVLGGLFLWFAAAALLVASRDNRSLGERAKENCDKQFGAGSEDSQECQLAILTNNVEQDRADRLKKAEADSER